MSKKLKIPKFKSEAQEREFWQKHDYVDYVDLARAKTARFVNLKPSTKTISLRLPAGLLDDIKVLAHKNDIPYQSLMKLFLLEKVHEKNPTS